jgi:hypothetical protein
MNSAPTNVKILRESPLYSLLWKCIKIFCQSVHHCSNIFRLNDERRASRHCTQLTHPNFHCTNPFDPYHCSLCGSHTFVYLSLQKRFSACSPLRPSRVPASCVLVPYARRANDWCKRTLFRLKMLARTRGRACFGEHNQFRVLLTGPFRKADWVLIVALVAEVSTAQVTRVMINA